MPETPEQHRQRMREKAERQRRFLRLEEEGAKSQHKTTERKPPIVMGTKTRRR